MSVYTELDTSVERKARGVAIGTFDGVHLGHQELLRRLVMQSRERGLVPTVFTFSNHPETVFGKKGDFPGYLMDEEHRLAAFKSLGIEDIFIFPLVPEIYELSAEQFLNRWLYTRLNAKLIAVGKDASFGAGKTGKTAFLREWCQRNEVTALIVDDVYLDGEKVSSTRIRKALLEKRVELANRMLVHPYRLRGAVERGRNLGSKHGVPTANFSRPETRLALPHGVYASRVEVDGRWFDAISNIGLSPTVDPTSETVRIESYIFDFNKDLYGKPIQVELLKFIRDEAVYQSFEAMLPQIESDMKETLEFFQTLERPVERVRVQDIPLICLDTNRFAFGQAAIVFRRRAVKGKMAAFALLLRLMAKRTSTYPRPFELERRLASMGDALLHPIISQEGDIHVLGLLVSAVEGDLEAELGAAIDLMFDALFHVFFDLEATTFDEWLEREKTELINSRLAEKENKIEYAIRLALEALLGDQPHALHPFGEIEELKLVSKNELVAAYDELLSEASVAFYLSSPRTDAKLESVVRWLEKMPPREPQPHVWPTTPLFSRRKSLQVETDTTQHIVIRGVKKGAYWYESERWAEILLNQMLDADQHAFLFKELRSRQSLCYEVFSLPLSIIGVTLYVVATTKENAERAKTAFDDVFRIVSDGRFTETDEAIARRFLDKALVSAWDHAAGPLYAMISWHNYGYPAHIDDKRAFAAAVRRDDLISVANRALPLMTFELVSAAGDKRREDDTDDA